MVLKPLLRLSDRSLNPGFLDYDVRKHYLTVGLEIKENVSKAFNIVLALSK